MVNDDSNQSADDALEPENDEIKAGKRDPLPEDHDTPAAPADSKGNKLPEDHPSTDSEIDSHELYDEGRTSATGIDAQDEKNENRKRSQYGKQE